MKKYLFLSLFVCLSLFSFSQQTKKVLFLGNSYTAVNNLPGMLSSIATSMGDVLIYDSNTPGGHTFNGHSTNATSITKINSNNWDYVVLQEQSQIPSFPPAQVQSDCYPYADSLNRMIQENDSCTITMFYMTWGRKNGDASNCAFYAPLCTYEGMQARLYQSYLEMGNNLDAEVSPVGAVWRQFRTDFPLVELYQSDESHPSVHGTYLAACTFYASIYHSSTTGAFVPAGITTQEATDIQNTVNTVVFDSLNLWRIDTTSFKADFVASSTGGFGYDFNSSYDFGDEYIWDFGDGNSVTTLNSNTISHTYSNSGNYTVELIVRKNCEYDTLPQNITVNATGIEPLNETNFKIYPNPATDQLFIEVSEPVQFFIYDVTGKLLFEKFLSEKKNPVSLSGFPNGSYWIQIQSQSGVNTQRLEILK